LTPSIQKASLRTFTFQQAATQIVNGIGNASAASTLTVEEPTTDTTIVETTARVPDGGTLLLGGQTIAGEIETEIGPPIVSKIPFLKRLFTNVSTAKDEQVLLILVKPTIILSQEAEAKRFPMLSSKVSAP